MKTFTSPTFAILLALSFAFTGTSLANEKDEDADDSANEVKIEKLTLVRDAGEKFEAVKNFKPTDIFGVLVKLSEPKIGTKVKGVWTAVDAGQLENKKIFEKEVTLTRDALKDAKEKDRIDFTLAHDNPYPTGDYKFEVYLNGELADAIEFTIE